MKYINLFFLCFLNVSSSLKPAKSNLKSLFEMSRPVTIPQTALLVFSGANVAHVPIAELFQHDFLISTGVSLLTCANSMIINDYFDAEKKNDGKEKNLIVAGVIDKNIVLNFLFVSYIIEICGILCIKLQILSFIISWTLLITICYTPIFKPVTWLKNISVAFVVALTPFVGALSSLGDSNVSYHDYDTVLKMCLAIFFTIMHKEIVMDVCDLEDDLNSGVVTIPGKYGTNFALNTSICLTFLTFLIVHDNILETVGALSILVFAIRCKKDLNDEKLKDLLTSFKYTSTFLICAFMSSN